MNKHLGNAVILLLALSGTALCADNTTRSVSITDAIQSAIATNLNTKLAAAHDDEARAKVIQSASSLLPSLLGTVSQSRILKENLNAIMGFGGSAGPFNSFDMRLQLSQSLLDLSSTQRYRAARAGLEMSRNAQGIAREQVASAAALAYVEAARTHTAVTAARADFNLAETLLNLAKHQHDNGIVTGLDVARSKTRFSDAKVMLLNAESAGRQAMIRLKRVAGWKLEENISLSEELTDSSSASPDIDAMLKLSAARPDIGLCVAEVEMLERMLSASKYSSLPTVVVSGNYGLSGNEPGNSIGTSSFGAALSVPLFSGGRISGQIALAESEMVAARARLGDAIIKVEEDVRLSAEIATEARLEVSLAAETVTLAEQELSMSQDRYIHGVGDNVELVTAQAELAKVRNNYVAALARNQQSRINLAAAVGRAQSFTLK